MLRTQTSLPTSSQACMHDQRRARQAPHLTHGDEREQELLQLKPMIEDLY